MSRRIVAALLLVHCAAPAPLAREVATALGPIRLGEAWDPAGAPEALRGDTVVGLPAGSVPGGGALPVHRTPEGTVHRIWRDYPQSADFAGLVKDYGRRFGAPRSHERPADVEQRERLVWEDAETRVELVRDPRRSAARVYAVLADRRFRSE